MREFTSSGARRRFRLLLTSLSGVVLISLMTAIASPESTPPYRIIQGEIRQGQTFTQALTSQGLPPTLAGEVIRALRPQLNFRKIRAGGVFQATLDATGQLVSFRYQASPVEVYEVVRRGAGYQARRREVPVQRRVEVVAGEVRSSLFEGVEALGEQPQLALDFVNIFLWDFDFHSQTRPGDRFRMLVEKEYSEETFVRYGRILAAQYENQGKTYTAIYFETGPGKGDFYTPDGASIRKTFLRSPLQFTRISSGYTHARHHPILGGVRPHLAVDYAAPHGTPVWAVADGVIEFAGWRGGNGKAVLIRHHQGYKTMYNHLADFAPGVRRGARVRQRQVIGYVGSTGLSTGPHLDYRVIKDGRFVNPLTRQFIPGAPIPRSHRGNFEQYRDQLLKQLAIGPGKPSPTARGSPSSS